MRAQDEGIYIPPVLVEARAIKKAPVGGLPTVVIKDLFTLEKSSPAAVTEVSRAGFFCMPFATMPKTGAKTVRTV